MQTKHLCCECEFDMTQAVKAKCALEPDNRMLLVKGMNSVDAASTVVLTCPKGHTCRYRCDGDTINHEHVEHGIIVPPEEKAEFDSLQSVFDAKASLDRIDSYAKWIFASSAIVGALGTGLSNGTLVKAHGMSLFLFTFAILCLGISLVAACQSIAPEVTSVQLYDIDDMRNKVNAHIKERKFYLTIAAWFYVSAIFLAALVPLLSMLPVKGTVKLTYSIDAKGLSADMIASGMKKGTIIELDVEGQGRHLAAGAVSADASGEQTIHLGPVTLEPGNPVNVIVKQRSFDKPDWEEMQRVSIPH